MLDEIEDDKDAEFSEEDKNKLNKNDGADSAKLTLHSRPGSKTSGVFDKADDLKNNAAIGRKEEHIEALTSSPTKTAIIEQSDIDE